MAFENIHNYIILTFLLYVLFMFYYFICYRETYFYLQKINKYKNIYFNHNLNNNLF